MKSLRMILTLVVVLASCVSKAQTKADYEAVMVKFQHYYNNNLLDSICTLYDHYKKKGSRSWIKQMFSIMKENQEDIISMRYMLVSDEPRFKGVTLFKVVTTKKAIILGCTLNKRNKFNKYEWNMPSIYKDSELFNLL